MNNLKQARYLFNAKRDLKNLLAPAKLPHDLPLLEIAVQIHNWRKDGYPALFAALETIQHANPLSALPILHFLRGQIPANMGFHRYELQKQFEYLHSTTADLIQAHTQRLGYSPTPQMDYYCAFCGIGVHAIPHLGTYFIQCPTCKSQDHLFGNIRHYIGHPNIQAPVHRDFQLWLPIWDEITSQILPHRFDQVHLPIDFQEQGARFINAFFELRENRPFLFPKPIQFLVEQGFEWDENAKRLIAAGKHRNFWQFPTVPELPPLPH